MSSENWGQRLWTDHYLEGMSWKDTLEGMKLGTENYVTVLGCPDLGTSPCLHRLLFKADKHPARQPLSIKRRLHLPLTPCTKYVLDMRSLAPVKLRNATSALESSGADTGVHTLRWDRWLQIVGSGRSHEMGDKGWLVSDICGTHQRRAMKLQRFGRSLGPRGSWRKVHT